MDGIGVFDRSRGWFGNAVTTIPLTSSRRIALEKKSVFIDSLTIQVVGALAVCINLKKKNFREKVQIINFTFSSGIDHEMERLFLKT